MRSVVAPLAALLALIHFGVDAGRADVLGLGGATYGDERGCRFQKINDYAEDTMLSLTGDDYQTYLHGCEFVQAVTARNGDRVVTGLCSEEGEAGTTIDFLRIARVTYADAYEIYTKDGDLLGRVDRCPP